MHIYKIVINMDLEDYLFFLFFIFAYEPTRPVVCYRQCVIMYLNIHNKLIPFIMMFSVSS